MPFPDDNRKQLLAAHDDACYYRERAAELEEDNRRQQEQRYESEERRRRERQNEIARSFRHADTWPEALCKQASLCRQENEGEDDYFMEMIEACELANDLWQAAEAETASAIAELQRQIDALNDFVALTVSSRLTEQDASSAAAEIAALMRAPDPDLDEWLNW